MITVTKGGKSLRIAKSQLSTFISCGWVSSEVPISESELFTEEMLLGISPDDEEESEDTEDNSMDLSSCSLRRLKAIGENQGIDMSEVTSKKQAIELITSFDRG